MSRKKEIRLLCAETDREALKPILEQLNAKGFRVSDVRDANRDDIVLAALSEAFYADAEKTESLLQLIGKGAENVLPLQLDGTKIPDHVKNALYARNIIPAADRDAAQIAERVAGAVPSAPSVLPKILIAGAAVLAVIAGIVIWRTAGRGKTAAGSPTPTAAVEQEEDIYLPDGWTQEDLDKVVDVIIVGDRVELYTGDDLKKNNGLYPEFDYFAYRDYYDDEAHWFSREDGDEYPMTRHVDLRFLELLPNLRFLTIAKIETGLLPDLKKLSKLQKLCLMDCEVPDLDWVGGSAILDIDLLNTTGSVQDFSPLTSCEKLSNVHLDINNTRSGDFSGFGPPQMTWLWINGDFRGDTTDLSGLKACTKLRECRLEYVPVGDLDFLSGASSMSILQLVHLERLEDISAVSGMKRLTELQIEDANRVRDFSPVAACGALEIFRVSCDRGQNPLTDVSFLGDLLNLKEISLGGTELRDLDFLVSLSAHRNSLTEFSFFGEIGDYEGLSAIRRYSRLSLDPDDGADFETIMSYLQGAEIGDLALRRFSGVDLSAIPMPSNTLELDRCTVTDLSSMPENAGPALVCLNRCQRLQSLNGLQNQSGIRNLEVFNCPRLTDWSALEGKDLNRFSVAGGYTLPAGIPFHAAVYRVESVADVTDLSFLSALDTDRRWCFELVGLDVNNLQPLSRFHGGYLTVPPELAEQAHDLVQTGNFGNYQIEYPQGGWEEDDSELTLLSLDELHTLPPAMLRRVTAVDLAGDRIIDRDRFDVWQDFKNDQTVAVLHDSQDDTQSDIPEGSFQDLTPFYEMTGLRRLSAAAQPITGLDGIQVLSELEEVEFVCCHDLTDISPLFTMQNLRRIAVNGCGGVTSIQGIQNLPGLTQLELSRSGVSDISPLVLCSLWEAEENGGFRLRMDDNGVTDFTPLSGFSHFAELVLNNMDCSLWIPCLANAQIDEFEACGCGFTAERLEEFVSGHPELRVIDIPWNEDLTDLTPLLGLQNLEWVKVSRSMKKAIASLDGRDYGFELRIDN